MDWSGSADRGGDSLGVLRSDVGTTLEELRRRNASAVGMDLLYLFTTAFLASLAARGRWPALVAAAPLVTFLYFAGRASPGFFLANVAAVVLAVAATYAGLMPI